MKIVICASIDFTPQIKEAAEKLTALGHDVEIPLTSRRIINGELTLEDFKREKQKNGDGSFRKIKDDVIKYYYEQIKQSDAVLILNIEKNSIANYIGGNTFLEMGFAHVLNKLIFLYRDIPDLSYTDEIKAMRPIVLNEDLSQIK
ncbi:MAG: hypothetical protein MUC28_01920 [Planctomycetes bacterium]|jgi:nucleoside 2-deoxyribosyltransferase|nr:hypothetical protein [Planctomycetota bacterium]